MSACEVNRIKFALLRIAGFDPERKSDPIDFRCDDHTISLSAYLRHLSQMAEGRLRRRLAAILASDVVGYSRLMEQDEAGTLAALRA
jgi:class 3 adenylate cyclase